MLTGIPFFEILESRKSFPGPATVDTWPFIFPDFKKHGYATLFSEDDPTFGVFNLRLHGFRDPPTDHYGRYFWMGVGLAKKHLCVGKLKTHEMQMNYARSLFDAYPRNPKFAFVMLSELTHNKPNRFQLMDVDLLGFIDSMKRAGHLDNTMFIIMSDHGSRYHKVRRSVNGKLEERLPMFALMMPPWFAANYPNLFANLKENSKQLTTPFDIHATLSHVLSYPDLPPRDKESFGQSLFSQIDKMRGCEEAGVEFHWCPCVSSSEMNSSSAQARDLAATVISFMNDLTSNHTDLCERLTLKEIGYVGRLMVHKKLHQFLGNSRKRVPRFNDSQVAQGDGEVFEIRLTTSPNDGAYEATAHLVGGTFHVMGDISRVNAYGDQPKCLLQKHAYLRKYCYCKKKTTWAWCSQGETRDGTLPVLGTLSNRPFATVGHVASLISYHNRREHKKLRRHAKFHVLSIKTSNLIISGELHSILTKGSGNDRDRSAGNRSVTDAKRERMARNALSAVPWAWDHVIASNGRWRLTAALTRR